MSDQYLGEVRMFGGTFMIRDWAACDGSPVPISQNETLFSLISNAFGGDGINSFYLPDLRGRIPIEQGYGPNLTPRKIGQMGGSENVLLTAGQIAPHVHYLLAANLAATEQQPEGAMPARGGGAMGLYASPGNGNQEVSMAPDVLQSQPGNVAHNNMMPSYAVSFIIALQGEYPARP